MKQRYLPIRFRKNSRNPRWRCWRAKVSVPLLGLPYQSCADCAWPDVVDAAADSLPIGSWPSWSGPGSLEGLDACSRSGPSESPRSPPRHSPRRDDVLHVVRRDATDCKTSASSSTHAACSPSRPTTGSWSVGGRENRAKADIVRFQPCGLPNLFRPRVDSPTECVRSQDSARIGDGQRSSCPRCTPSAFTASARSHRSLMMRQTPAHLRPGAGQSLVGGLRGCLFVAILEETHAQCGGLASTSTSGRSGRNARVHTKYNPVRSCLVNGVMRGVLLARRSTRTTVRRGSGRGTSWRHAL